MLKKLNIASLVFIFAMMLTTGCSKQLPGAAFSKQGVKFFNESKYDSAIESFEKAISVTPENYEYYNYLVKSYIRLGMVSQEPDKKKKYLSDALMYAVKADNLHPDSSNVLTNLGHAYAALGGYTESIEQYERALHINNDFSKINRNYGKWQLDNSIMDAYIGLAYACGSTGDYNKAIEIYRKAAATDSNNPYVYFNLGRTNYYTGQYEESVKYLEKAVSLKGNDPGIYNDLGKAYAQTGKDEQAIEAFEEAIKLNPDYADPYYNLAILYKVLKKTDKSEEMMKRARELSHKA
jgi:tetratricopeptide (TPR) repeat protein